MKRTYVNRLPKNEEVKNTNVRVENGQLFVEVEFKEKFEPNDGDFCVDYYGNTFILCEEGNVGINHGSYALFFIGEMVIGFSKRTTLYVVLDMPLRKKKSLSLNDLKKNVGSDGTKKRNVWRIFISLSLVIL